MIHFWDSDVWSAILLFSVLTGSLLIGNTLRRKIALLKNSMIPTAVIGGGVLLIIAAIYKAITGNVIYDTPIFGGNGTSGLEIITYHSLALGFIASSLKSNKKSSGKKRATEIFNTGVTTVSTYLLQGVVGLIITVVCALFIKDFFAGAGLLLPFGYGQGTGQALNYGVIYEEKGFVGGSAFALTIAAFGFISAAVGGVLHLNIRHGNGKLRLSKRTDGSDYQEVIETEGEIPMQESVDKMTIQIALIIAAYVIAYFIMKLLVSFLPDMDSIIFGFNFLLGVIGAMIVRGVLSLLRKSGLMKRKYTNNFLMTRTSNFFFDLMIVSGVAAIRLDDLKSYWGIMIALCLVGAIVTYIYLRIVCKKLFPDYEEEQFLMMYGMLTGTASTGTILLREIDGNFNTPAADNMVYQNFPAIVFGLPLMLLAGLAPTQPVLTLIILFIFFVVMNILLFRSFIFKRKKEEKYQTM